MYRDLNITKRFKIHQAKLKRKMHNLTIAVADFNSLSIMREQFIWKPPNYRRHGQYNLQT